MSSVERWAFFNHVYNKYREEDQEDFYIYFSDEKIAAMSGKIGSWKLSLS